MLLNFSTIIKHFIYIHNIMHIISCTTRIGFWWIKNLNVWKKPFSATILQSLSITSVLRSRQLHGLLKLNVLGFNIFISSNSDLKEKLVMDFSPLYLYHSSDAFYYLWPLTGASWFPGLFRTALNSALHINQISAP